MFPKNFILIDRISCQNPASSKKRVLEEISRLLVTTIPSVTPDQLFDRLLERERLGSTGLGQGIALPHARIAGVDEAFGALLQLESAVDFDAVDDQPVDLAFGMVVPQDATQEHLQLLAKLAALFSDEAFCARLRAARDEESMLREIRNREELAQGI